MNWKANNSEKQLHEKWSKEDKEFSTEEEENSNKNKRLPTGGIKKLLHYREEFQFPATKRHTDKTKMTKLVSWLKRSA